MMKKIVLATLSGAVVVVVGMTAFYIQQTYVLKDTPEGETPVSVDTLEQARLIGGLSGAVIMELIYKTGDDDGQWTYALNLNDPYIPTLDRAPNVIWRQDYGFSFTDTHAVFVQPVREPGEAWEDLDILTDYQVVSIPIGTTPEGESFPEGYGVPKPMTDSEAKYKRMPVISKDGKRVLYMARAESENNLATEAGSWSIYLSQEDLTSTEVARGMYPKWIDDNRFMYMANDGLMLHDIANGEEVALWGMETGKAMSYMRLDVSDDGKYIAWIFPNLKKVGVIEVKSWGDDTHEMEMSVVGLVDTNGSWVVFSPDSKYLMVQVFGEQDEYGVENPKINMYAVQADGLKKLDWQFDLSAFDHRNMFITDWIKRY